MDNEEFKVFLVEVILVGMSSIVEKPIVSTFICVISCKAIDCVYNALTEGDTHHGTVLIGTMQF